MIYIHSKTSKHNCYIIVTTNTYKKGTIRNGIKHFLKIYKGMKIIITKNVRLNMHNIYVTLSCLQSIDGFIILQNITMQEICKVNFKKRSLKTLESISKHNITKHIQNNNPLKSCKEKNKHLIMIGDLNDDNIDNNIVNY